MKYFYTTADILPVFEDFAKKNGLHFYQFFDIDPYRVKGSFVKNDKKNKVFDIDIVLDDLSSSFICRLLSSVLNAMKEEPKEMTISDIEKELGYKIRIINDKGDN